MIRLLLFVILALLTASCGQKQEVNTHQLQQLASFRLDENTELHLLTDSNLSQVELYYDGEEGNGPWALVRLPFDCPAIEDTDGDGHMEILGHSPKEPNYHVYSFSHGLLNLRHSLCTWEECHVAN